jgi:hypothetical protein
LQIPITGRPSNTSPGNPWFRIQLRWRNPSLSLLPNQACDRNVLFFIFAKSHPLAAIRCINADKAVRPNYTT